MVPLPFLEKLIAAPYVSLVAFSGTILILDSWSLASVSRNRRVFYCSVKQFAAGSVMTVFSAVVLLITMGFEAWSVYLLYTRWRLLRQEALVDLGMIARALLFGVYSALCFLFSLLSFLTSFLGSPMGDLLMATTPSVVVIIFGTSKVSIEVRPCQPPELVISSGPTRRLAPLEVLMLRQQTVDHRCYLGHG
ncbi:hypothetical protein BDV98DRAFT_224481 [Pterulicium gracile]|uniref:Uncharacterized protein n=1 Tax=Pterulicium gracile TaxID=1884261 RepID=A0A5C3QUF5_9AGAR|nr:hypothetical protein BDV98DRAFT_224481 [Pterula gracilis]